MTLLKLLTAGLRPLELNPSQPPSLRQRQVAICFGLSLLTPLYFGLISWHYAATSGPIIQDDVRLHIVWLQRLIDPTLFPNDVIADYYSTLQAVGFKAIYTLAATLGLEPLTLAQILPLGLALVTTVYLFWASLRLLPVPLGGVLTTVVLNQNIWLKDDLISATPRAFIYPVFAAFLYYLLTGATLPWLMALILQGLFYPQMMLVSAGILTLRLIRWNGYPSLPKRLSEYLVWAIAIGLTLAILLFFAHQVETQVGPVISEAAMRQMPEFHVNGRREYFGVSPLNFWFSGASGLRFPLFPPIIWLGALFPLMSMGASAGLNGVRDLPGNKVPGVGWVKDDRRCPSKRLADGHTFVFSILGRVGLLSCPSLKFPLATHLTAQTRILAELLLSAVGLFLLAHLLFPTLYLPSRYTFYSVRFLMAIATGLSLTLLLDRIRSWLKQRHEQRHEQRPQWRWGDRIKVTVGLGMAIAILTVPAIPSLFLPCQGWVLGETPQIYQQLSQTPNDTLVASLDPEASNIPAFSHRSVWVSGEFALPYHADFYRAMLRRMEALVKAQYSPDLEEVQSFVKTAGVDRWLVHQDFASPDYLLEQSWLVNSSIQATIQAITENLRQGMQPALQQMIPACTLLEENERVLLDAHCLSTLQ